MDQTELKSQPQKLTSGSGFGRTSLALTTGSFLLLSLLNKHSCDWKILWPTLVTIGIGDAASDALGIYHEHTRDNDEHNESLKAALRVFGWKSLGTFVYAAIIIMIARMVSHKIAIGLILLATFGLLWTTNSVFIGFVVFAIVVGIGRVVELKL